STRRSMSRKRSKPTAIAKPVRRSPPTCAWSTRAPSRWRGTPRAAAHSSAAPGPAECGHPGHGLLRVGIRLSSLEAAEARDDLARMLANRPRIVPHLHLCLQSGSDRVLAAMKRRYRSVGFLERWRRLRQALDQSAFTTDVIVGFPGETEEDFQATCRV